MLLILISQISSSAALHSPAAFVLAKGWTKHIHHRSDPEANNHTRPDTAGADPQMMDTFEPGR